MADEARLNESAFWRLGGLSNEQLLERLAKVLGSGRRLLAELIAHLGEVEERRLHLAASCGSMFEYCVSRLGLSEDEACRRIQVSRLARRFPATFNLLASGELSLSVAALLAPHLTLENAAELLRHVSRQSVRQAREALAARFPQADVPSSVRKPPDRSVVSTAVHTSQQSLVDGAEAGAGRGHRQCGAPEVSELPPMLELASTNPPLATPSVSSASPGNPVQLNTSSAATSPIATLSAGTLPGVLPADTPSANTSAASMPRASEQALAPKGSAVSVPHRPAVVEPLAPERYRIQFTACADLKAKLELARDLLRHTIPDGDFGAIMGRALDLLVEQLLKRRFGARSAASSPSSAPGRCASAKRGDLQTRNASSSPESRSAGPTRMDSSPTQSSPTGSSPDAPTRGRLQADQQSREAPIAGPHLNTSGSEAPRAEASYASIEHADAPTRDRPHADGQHRETPEAAADSDALHVAPHADGPSRASPPAEQPHAEQPPVEQPRAISTSAASTSRFSYISRATRRRVVERDGLRCSWTDEHGTRCESRAWLEFDHQTPLAKGGGSRPENVRLLCRNHNRLAAEQAFGKPHIDQAIATRKQTEPSPLDPQPAE